MKEKILSILKWYLVLVLAHIAFDILYIVFPLQVVAQLVANNYLIRGVLFMLAFGLLCQILFCVLYSMHTARYGDYRSKVKDAIKSGEVTVNGYLKKTYLKDCLIKTAFYGVLLVLFSLFYAPSIVPLSRIQRFFVAERAIYLFLGRILGIVANALIFFLFFTACQYVFLLHTWKSISNDIEAIHKNN